MLARSFDLETKENIQNEECTGGNNPLLYKPGALGRQVRRSVPPDISSRLPMRRVLVTSMFCEEEGVTNDK